MFQSYNKSTHCNKKKQTSKRSYAYNNPQR